MLAATLHDNLVMPFRSLIRKKTELYDDAYFNAIREKEYKRLDEQQQVYLDYTGGNLYGNSQLEQHFKTLQQHTFGNPHSSNPTSKQATQLVEDSRQKVLDFFNAQDYHCIFTSNASGALKIVGESYPFHNDGHYLLLADNHNSVNGIREYCTGQGGTYEVGAIRQKDLTIDAPKLRESLRKPNNKHKLFAYPAQSNVSGNKHSLDWIAEAKEQGWDVLLDAAAFVPTSKLDLQKHQPDFVSVSFYKIFGFPTGIGCLLVHKSAFHKLQKKWFAGGTVQLASANSQNHILHNNHECFENGTVNYLDIPAVKTGLGFIETIGMDKINKRVHSLKNYLHRALSTLQHSDGRPQLRIYGDSKAENKGGNLMMNFYDVNGQRIDFEIIEKLANDRNISLRTGCFCNPGIDEVNNGLNAADLDKYFSGESAKSYTDMITQLGKKRGAVRISVGIATTKKDLDYFIAFAKSMANYPAAKFTC